VTPEAARQARTRLLAAFAAIYIIWGSTYLAIAFAIQGIPPFLMAAGRMLLAGGALYLWARPRAPAPRRSQWSWAFLMGGLFFLFGNGAVVWVEQHMASGLTALIVAMVSVWTAILEWVRPGGSRPPGMVLTGIVLGFGGVALLVMPGGSGPTHADPAGVLLLMCSTFAWALASVLSRTADLPSYSPLTSGMEMLGGGVLLLVLSLVTGDAFRFDPSAVSLKALLSFIYLVTFGSLVAFTCFAWLLKVTSPNKVAIAGYVNPMVAVFLGWAFGGETLTTTSFIASMVIVLGVVLIITGREIPLLSRPSPAPRPPVEPLARRDKVVT
jgi:drug/metabolite transporter (DMT)-like permease